MCIHVQVGMGDLGEGEEGGGAGLEMGDVFGGVVTFDVTVGGALGESEWKKESGRDDISTCEAKPSHCKLQMRWTEGERK